MKGLYLTVFLVSCSVLVFEVSLTRIFSITLWYHFAFMVISIAMLGIGSAGTVLAVCTGILQGPDRGKAGMIPDIKNISARVCSASNIPFYSLMTGVSIVVCFMVSNRLPFDPARFSWERLQLLYLFIYCFILSIPFFFSGILIATVFSFHSDKSMSVYSADLTGAGTGSLVVIVLLNSASPEYAIIAASSLCLAGALFHGGRRTAVAAIFFLVINLFLTLYHPAVMNLKISPYKNLSFYLRYPGAEHLRTYNSSYSRIDVFKSPGIRYAPGLSLKYSEPLPDQTGLATDGQRIDVMTDPRNRSQLKFIAHLPSALAFGMSSRQRALILDPKGGLHTLLAEYYGFDTIINVESDPSLLEIVRRDFGDYSGGIYASNSATGYGRNFLSRKSESDNGRYDLIDIAMTGTAVSGTSGISEDYRYTVNAFMKYLDSLKDDGFLSISIYLIPPYRAEFRLVATIMTALEQSGISDASSGIAAIRSWDVMTVVSKKSPLTEDEIRSIKKFSSNWNFDVIFYPGIHEYETNRFIKTGSNDLVQGFRSIADHTTRASFIDGYLFDIDPVYDRNPFFHYFLKVKNIDVIYKTMGRKLLYFLNEGYVLPVILCIVLLLSFLIILLPAVLKAAYRRNAPLPEPVPGLRTYSTLPALVYFSMIGLGFMFVEVPLIQTSILPVENPSLCVSIILTTILVSSGSGSMLGSRYRPFNSAYSLLVLAVLITAYTLLQPFLISTITGLGLPLRILALSGSIVPVGFLMGLPFPMGMQILGHKNRELIPWAWAVNACLSVTAPLLSILLALVSGFHIVLWMSVLAYLTAFGALMTLSRSERAAPNSTRPSNPTQVKSP